jgi:hypothetical protein
MGRSASRRVKAINLERIFQSLKGFTGLAPDSIYQRDVKISNALTLINSFRLSRTFQKIRINKE